jgi:hypothetical protein
LRDAICGLCHHRGPDNTSPRRLLLIGLFWLANQTVGFGVLDYPWTADCLAWGVGLE